MKPLKNNVLIYDGDCPMCRMYSHAFVRTNMLEDCGIQAYAQITEELKSEIDMDKARNEIALVDKANHSVSYGIDSWFKIFSNSFALFGYLSRFKPFYLFMKGLYFLISYNRRVIAPGKEFYNEGSCDPDYNIKWRWVYIIISSVLVAVILHTFLKALPVYSNANLGIAAEWLIVTGQLLFQGIFLYFIRRDRMLHYFGQLMTISLIGALLLIPAAIFQGNIFQASPWLYLGYFGITLIIMLWQHLRRTTVLELPFLLTCTWLGYRVLLLIVFLLITKMIEL